MNSHGKGIRVLIEVKAVIATVIVTVTLMVIVRE